jgi:large subunit ribosomal protein L24
MSKDLREKYHRKTLRAREGDSVKIIRGEFKDIEGKVTRVIQSEGQLTVEGVTREKQKGGNAPVAIFASNVVITAVNLGDARRKKKLEAEK